MPRKRKYPESTTATSEAQKAAMRAYYQRKKAAGEAQKVIAITMNQTEYESSRATLAAHGLTPLQAWRRLMDELNAERGGTINGDE